MIMAEETFTVVGGHEVAGVPNGGTITRAELLAYDSRVHIDALVAGGHLAPVKSAEAKSETKKAGG
jgi:hypothetical protein